MQRVTYTIVPDPAKNSIRYSKNYRIFTTGEPIKKAVRLVKPSGFTEELELGTALTSNIYRKFRYSTNRADWSLWYDFSPNNMTDIEVLEFEEADVFFEFKYIYDDGSYDQLENSLKIERLRLFIETTQQQGADYTPPVQCSEEQCPMIIAENDSLFKPYEAAPAIQIAHEMSLKTNKIFGHDVIYFKTEPDRDGGDFIFKEWTLFKTVIRKCIKVMVPDNKFPDNKPMFAEAGVDFEIPFELHIDNIYFQQMFGRNAQPRKKDYLYFPLLNRMYEIQGSYLYRGFMMEPIYWKIQLTKFHPNIDMYMKAEDRTFLDNLINSTEQLYGTEQSIQELDALNPQQTKTISTKFDETRRDFHKDLLVKILGLSYNYSPLIEYYYDMSKVSSSLKTYTLETFAIPNQAKTQTISMSAPYEIIAYEDSDIFGAWQACELSTGDSNVNSSGTTVKIKMNGPKESYSPFGKYVVIEGYKNLGFLSTERRSVLTESNNIQFIKNVNAITYKRVASTSNLPNMTFCNIFNLNRGTQYITFFNGYDTYDQKGFKIVGYVSDNLGSDPTLTIYVTINETTYTFSVGTVQYAKWYSMIIPVSAQYGQFQVNVYSFNEDPANLKNFNGITSIYRQNSNPGIFEFETTVNYSLPSANYLLANIRLFNTMIQLEDHEFVISQLFVRDESMLAIIDNARPRLNTPFIAINR